MIERAAALTGQTVSGFAVCLLAERAKQVVADHAVTRVSVRDWERINDLLASPSRPGPRLRRAARRFRGRSA